jgi:NSS family neurotransmitter:Na+ symporter
MQQGVAVEEVAGAGVGLAFMTFPTAISTLPALNAFFGVCFFGALFTAGITSLISIIQAVVTGIMDKFDLSHRKAVTMVLVPAFIVSILFITGAGLTILDIVDAFVNNIGVAGCGLLEVLLIGWFFSPEKLRQAANEYSNFSIGKWWTYCLKIVTVIVLGIMIILNIKTYITEGYGGYAQLDVTLYGWGAVLIIVLGSIIFTSMKGKDGYRDLSRIAEKEVN